MAQFLAIVSVFLSIVMMLIDYPIHATYAMAMAVLFLVLYLIEEVKNG